MYTTSAERVKLHENVSQSSIHYTRVQFLTTYSKKCYILESIYISQKTNLLP